MLGISYHEAGIDYKNLTLVAGTDRKSCPKGHSLEPSEAKL